jgi:hypothetical protein
VLSADNEFQEEGAESGICWHDVFDEYFQYLQVGLDQRKASVLQIFHLWDAEFFPNVASTLGAQPPSIDEAATANALHALNADEEGLGVDDET